MSASTIQSNLKLWHQVVEKGDSNILEELLADDVIFYSPVVFSPQKGKAITKMYLTAAAHVLNNEHWKYLREITDGNTSMLEFETKIDGVLINGVDIITWNEEGQMQEFKVMVRPLQGVNKIHEMMMAMLNKMKSQKK